jgi:hypothetical protein
MKASFPLLCSLFLALQAAHAEPFKASATLKLDKTKEVEAAETQAFLDQVKSRPALDEIAARLALGQAWKLDGDQTAARLSKSLGISVSGHDGKITAESDSPVMAAILANTAADVLKDRGGETGGKSMAKLNETVQQQQEAVKGKRELLSKIIREQRIIYPGEEKPATEEPSPIGLQSFVDAKNDYETAQRLLTELEKKQMVLKTEGSIGVHHVIWAKAPEE